MLTSRRISKRRHGERAGGELREKFGEAKEKVKDAADDLIDDDEDE